jgi:hypothetical protein
VGITQTFTHPFYTGLGVSSLVPALYPVAIGGEPFLIDTNPELGEFRWRHETIPLLRSQSDDARSPDEASLNPEALWRRAQGSWHRGAGQAFYDRDPQLDDPYRFSRSKGVDVWERYELSLLPSTDNKKSGVATNWRVVPAGSRLYVTEADALAFTADVTAGSPTWTPVTGYSGGSITAITSDGFTVYFTDGANIWTTTTSVTSATSADTTNADMLSYVKGRLMVAVGNILYNIPTLGSAATLTFTHPNSAWRWTACAEGRNHIYASGFAGDQSRIYKTTIQKDGTALEIPTEAGRLPDGEIIRDIHGYLGNVWVGTDHGWRYAEADADGNLSVGVLVETPAAVRCFEGQDKFVWFGWSNYDAASTGLGRSDFTEKTVDPGANQIAYASDLMVTGQGEVLSVATFQETQVFTVSGLGVYAQDTPLVATGTLETGEIGFGLPDNKTLIFLDVRTRPLDGSWYVELSTDEGDFEQQGPVWTEDESLHGIVPLEAVGERFNIRFNLARDSVVTTTGPEILRWTLKALPAPEDGSVQRIYLPLMLYKNLRVGDQVVEMNVRERYDRLMLLRSSHVLTTLQEIDRTYTGKVEDVRYLPYGMRADEDDQWRFPDGTALCVFKAGF